MKRRTILASLLSVFLCTQVLAATYTVIDEKGDPISDAQILIGIEKDKPFQGNMMKTNNQGEFNTPANWKSNLPVTVSADGYVTASFIDISPNDAGEFQLSPVEGNKSYQLKGVTKGYGSLKKDGYVDFGLVIPAFQIEDLIRFDLSSVISGDVDTIKIVGKEFELPANLSLPNQTENYSFFPIRLNKPGFRVQVRNPGKYRFYAAHGKFPLKKVVDDFQNKKSIFEVMERFQFIEGGFRDMNLDKDKSADLNVNQFKFNKSVKIKGPKIPNGKTMISLALADFDGYLVPTDVKQVKQGQQRNLKSTGKGLVLSALTNSQNLLGLEPDRNLDKDQPWHMSFKPYFAGPEKNDFAQMSLALTNPMRKQQPEFLMDVAAPKVDGDKAELQAPQMVGNVKPVSTILVLSEIEDVGKGNVKSEKRTRIWQLVSNGWMSRTQMPKVKWTKKANRRYRWEVLYLGKDATARIDSEITHVTRNALDF